MADKLDFPIVFKGAVNDWFSDPRYKRIFSGSDHGMKCVCAIGPADFSRVCFAWSSSPRDKLQRVSKESSEQLVVHEALWFPLMQSKDVLEELRTLLTRAGVQSFGGWCRFPVRFLRPLMLQAGEKAGFKGLWHKDFHAQALETETLKLRARLVKAEVEPDVVAAHRYV